MRLILSCRSNFVVTQEFDARFLIALRAMNLAEIVPNRQGCAERRFL
jgi:hypothetical protein